MEVLLNLEYLYSCSPRTLFPLQCLLLESEGAEVHGTCPSRLLVAVLAITGGPRAANLMGDFASQRSLITGASAEILYFNQS